MILKNINNNNLARDKIPDFKKWIHIKVIVYLSMVPEILKFVDRPN